MTINTHGDDVLIQIRHRPRSSQTEEDPQEQLQLKVPSGCHEQDGQVPCEDWKEAALVCYNASTLLVNGNMWHDTNKL